MFPHFFKDVCCLFLFFAVLFLTISCGIKADESEKQKVEYKICKDTELPDELKVMIDEHKEKGFQLIYGDSAYDYLSVGYGEQKSKNYVVSIKEFYGVGNRIILDTVLINHSKSDPQKSGQPDICPYIVIRCELTEEAVEFR